MLTALDHVGIAVASLDEAIASYRDRFALVVEQREVLADQGVEAVMLAVGDGHVELLAALGPDTPVGRFLRRRGPGLHHVAYRTDDIETALASLRGAGMELIDEQPRRGIGGSRVAFVHPRSVDGVLTEIVEPAR